MEAFLANKKVTITEKLDGSNVAIRVIDGKLVLQSRTTIIDQAKPGMFAHFVDWARGWMIPERMAYFVRNNVTLYGEMLGNGKIKYRERAPFICFAYREDGTDGTQYFDPRAHTQGWDLSYAPILYQGEWQGTDHAQSFVGQSAYADREMEGVVISAFDVMTWYEYVNDEGFTVTVNKNEPIVMGKIVTEAFKETKAPKTSIKDVDDPHAAIIEAVVTEARIQKAKQRAAEEGKDITRPHVLIPYVAKDVNEEDLALVKDLLYKVHSKDLGSKIAQRVIALA